MDLGNIFGNLYTSLGLEDLYGAEPNELADYLWGNASSVVTTNQFVWIGFITLAISFFIFITYYYILGHLFRKPSWGNILTWMIALVVNCSIAFTVGWQYTLSDLYANLMITIDPITEAEVALPIEELNCLQFGGVNAMVSIMFFIIFCLIGKWWSRDYSHIPF